MAGADLLAVHAERKRSLRSNRATVRALTRMRRRSSCAAILAVVRGPSQTADGVARPYRAPAVCSIAAITSGVFFPPACAPRPASGPGPRPHPEPPVGVVPWPPCAGPVGEIRRSGWSPPRPSLSDSRPAYKRRCCSSSELQNKMIAARSSSETCSRCAILPALRVDSRRTCRANNCCRCCWLVRSTIQIQLRDLQAADPVLPDQMQQWFLDGDVKQRFQFPGKVAGWSLINEGFCCVQQGTVTGKPNRVECP